MDPYLLVCPACGGTNRLPRSRPAEAARCGRCKAALFDGHPVALDATTFDRHLTIDGIPLLVDFWAAWCGPCKAMAPVFEAAAKAFEPRVRFAKLDTDAVPEIAQRYGIRSIPTLVLFEGGRERARQAGALGPGQLRQWLEGQLPPVVSEDDRRRWEERWTARTGEPRSPEPFLVRQASALPPGPILDVASGDGRNALHLASLGHAVTAIDIAPAAQIRLEVAAATRGLSITTRVADLDEASALAGLGSFGGLVVIRFKPSRPQWDRLLHHLQPGGRLLLCSFGLEQHRRHGFNAAFCLDRGELEALLCDRLRLLLWESWREKANQLEGSLWEQRRRAVA